MTKQQEIKNISNSELVAVYRISLMTRSTVGFDRQENEAIIETVAAEMKARKISIAKSGNPKYRNADCYAN